VQEKQQTKKEVTREKNQQLILAAAEKLFSELGYDGASMSKIAKEAALPKANVLYYFKNKDNLYETVLDNILAEWNLGLDNVSIDDDPASVLYNYIKNKVILAVEKPVPSRLFASEMIRGAPYLQDYLLKSTRPWIQAKYNLFQGWIAAGKMDKVDPNHLLFAIWSTTQYYADFQAEVLLVLDKPAYEHKDVVAITQSIAQIILKGIGLTLPPQAEQ
jgi:TetR/AcrR family transcriptional regulator